LSTSYWVVASFQTLVGGLAGLLVGAQPAPTGLLVGIAFVALLERVTRAIAPPLGVSTDDDAEMTVPSARSAGGSPAYIRRRWHLPPGWHATAAGSLAINIVAGLIVVLVVWVVTFLARAI
jgi:hypothetical protein